MESSGHYWLKSSSYPKRKLYKICRNKPVTCNESKELDDNSPTKNDVKDAKVIAQVVKDGRYTEPTIPQKVFMLNSVWRKKYVIS